MPIYGHSGCIPYPHMVISYAPCMHVCSFHMNITPHMAISHTPPKPYMVISHASLTHIWRSPMHCTPIHDHVLHFTYPHMAITHASHHHPQEEEHQSTPTSTRRVTPLPAALPIPQGSAAGPAPTLEGGSCGIGVQSQEMSGGKGAGAGASLMGIDDSEQPGHEECGADPSDLPGMVPTVPREG